MVVADNCYSIGFHVLNNLPTEVCIGQLGLCRLNGGNAHSGSNLLYLGIELLGEQAAVYANVLRNGSIGRSHIHLHYAKVLLGRKNLESLGGIVRGNYNLKEDGLHAAGNICGKSAVYTHDTAVDAHLVGLVSCLPCFFDGLADCCAARIHVLEGNAERLVLKVAEHVKGSVCILYIIVRQLFTLNLLCKSQRVGSGLKGCIEISALMRVLAVTEALLKVILKEQLLVKTGSLTHISCDACIVFCSVSICLCRQFKTGFVRCLAVGLELVEHGTVIGRIANDGNVFPVLGSTADHGRTADVDILDGIFKGYTLLSDGLTERIEVYAYKLDGLDAVLFKGFHVGRNVPAGKDTAVYLGMKGFYAAVANLRKAGNFTDADCFYALALKELLGTACGDDFPAEVYESLYELYKAGFVTYTD